MRKGFIYILSNNSLKENLLKIGKTGKTTSDRNKQLSSSTSIPENFKTEFEFEFSDINWAEKKIHSKLSKYRYNKRKEFFNCDIQIAKQVIIEIQIIDKQNEISNLKSNLNNVTEILNNSEFLIHKWNIFFKNLNWNFIKQNRKDNYLIPNFILKTKSWDINHKGEMEIFEKETNLFLIPNLPENSENINSLNEIKEIIEISDDTKRLMLIPKSPIEGEVEIFLGWEYNFISENWEKCKFIQSENKIGLFDEERTWFCMINGKSLERNDLFPDTKLIMENWNDEKPAHNTV